MKPRVFVSSVIKGFEKERQAIKDGITAAGGTPVLVEDFPSKVDSPRNACLDGVKSCDFLVLILAERGGYVSPSGKLVVEEEFEEAKAENIPTILFLKNTERDDTAAALEQKLSDYVSGKFRVTFESSDELKKLAADSLTPLFKVFDMPKHEENSLLTLLSSPHEFHDTTVLRFALSPENNAELLKSVDLDSDDLKQELYELGHRSDVKLFSFERQKQVEDGTESIIIIQSDNNSHDGTRDGVRLEISKYGIIIIDLNITGLTIRGKEHDLINMFGIVEEDFEKRLEKCFHFSKAFFDKFDPYERFTRFLYNTSMSGIGYRKFCKSNDKSDGHSMADDIKDVLLLHENPKVISRDRLGIPANLCSEALSIFKRKIK